MAIEYECGSVGLTKLASCGTQLCDESSGIRYKLYPHTEVEVTGLSENDRRYFGPAKDPEGGQLVKLHAVIIEPGLVYFDYQGRSLCASQLPAGTRIRVKSVSPNMPGGDPDERTVPTPFTGR
jgi:hypothetical protein